MMRGGPGLGNIAPSQSDYFQATRGGGHGDYHSIVLSPASVEEAHKLMFLAFELADKYRGPAILLGDGMLGQMMEPLEILNPKSKIKKYDKPWALTGCAGRKPNIIRSLLLAEGALEELNLRLQDKYRRIRESEQRWEGLCLEDASIVLVAYGGMSRIVKSAVKRLRLAGVKAGFIRPISLWPFPAQAFSSKLKPGTRYLVVEMSYGQMLEDVRLAVNGKCPVDFFGRAGGGIPSEEQIIAKIKK